MHTVPYRHVPFEALQDLSIILGRCSHHLTELVFQQQLPDVLVVLDEIRN